MEVLSPCCSFRDYRQIAFVKLKQKPHPLFLTDNIEYHLEYNIEFLFLTDSLNSPHT